MKPSILYTAITVGAWLLPSFSSAESPSEALKAHQKNHNHSVQPEKLAGEIFFDRVWLLIEAIRENTSDKEIYQKRLDSAWNARKTEMCSPAVQTKSAIKVAAFYKSSCPQPPPTDPDTRSGSYSSTSIIKLTSKSETKRVSGEWFDLQSEVRDNQSILTVESDLGVLVVTPTTEFFVDAEFADNLSGAVGPKTTATNIEDTLRLGLELTEQAHREELKLSALADPATTEALLGLTDALIDLPAYQAPLGLDPEVPVDLGPAHKVVRSTVSGDDQLRSFIELSNTNQALANNLLLRALTNHPVEALDIRLQLDLGDGGLLTAKKIRPKDLDDGSLEVKRGVAVDPATLQGFKILEH